MVWLNEKTRESESNFKTCVIRFFYFFTEFESVISKDLNLLWDEPFDFLSFFGINEDDFFDSSSINWDISASRILSAISIIVNKKSIRQYTKKPNPIKNYINTMVENIKLNKSISSIVIQVPIVSYSNLKHCLYNSSNLKEEVQNKTLILNNNFPDLNIETFDDDDEKAMIEFVKAEYSLFLHWVRSTGEKWKEQLKTVMIKYRNIGHDWQFNDEQKKLLKQYYDANLLLVECLNSDCYVSREVRQEIEETLLLPIEEIEKWKSRRKDEH